MALGTRTVPKYSVTWSSIWPKGLIGLGVNKGDSVAIVSHTRWEWTALDMAIMSIGALTVPVYETNSASQVSWTFQRFQSHARHRRR